MHLHAYNHLLMIVCMQMHTHSATLYLQRMSEYFGILKLRHAVIADVTE